MKMPWQDQSVLMKALVIFASALGISLGLCGLNFAIDALDVFHGEGWAGLLVLTGMAESICILVSLSGLLGVSLLLVGREILRHFRPPKEQD